MFILTKVRITLDARYEEVLYVSINSDELWMAAHYANGLKPWLEGNVDSQGLGYQQASFDGYSAIYYYVDLVQEI